MASSESTPKNKIPRKISNESHGDILKSKTSFLSVNHSEAPSLEPLPLKKSICPTPIKKTQIRMS